MGNGRVRASYSRHPKQRAGLAAPLLAAIWGPHLGAEPLDPSQFAPIGPGGSLTLSGGQTATFDTTTLAAQINGVTFAGVLAPQLGGSSIAVFDFNTISVEGASVLFTGSRPAALLSRGDISLSNSVVTAAGQDGANGAAGGPGGAAGGPGGMPGAGPGAGARGNSVQPFLSAPGGGGAGFGGAGGSGAAGANGIPGGTGGPSYGSTFGPLLGGSGGGGGGISGTPPAPAGGGGGGAVEIVAVGSFSLVNSQIRDAGGSGAAGTIVNGNISGGAGGGSGGSVLLAGAALASSTSSVLAAGGAGGAGTHGGGGGAGGRVGLYIPSFNLGDALPTPVNAQGGFGGPGAALGHAGAVTLVPAVTSISDGRIFSGPIYLVSPASGQLTPRTEVALRNVRVTAGGAVTQAASEVLASTASLSIEAGGSYRLGGFTQTLGVLDISGGTLDVGTGTLRIAYGAAPSPLATIRSYLTSAYQGGGWTGAGINTSAADADHSLGYGDTADGIITGQPSARSWSGTPSWAT